MADDLTDFVNLDGGRATVLLPEAVGVAEASTLADACREVLESGGEVAVDATRSERLHAAGLQCLVALSVGLSEQGRALSWTPEVPDRLQQQAVQLGLVSALGLTPTER